MRMFELTSAALQSALLFAFGLTTLQGFTAEFDSAPFAQPLPEGTGLIWEDPREIHKVTVKFDGTANCVRYQYAVRARLSGMMFGRLFSP